MKKYVLTGVITAIAVVLALLKYMDYVDNPWTRDGQVRANVIQVAARVSGPIVKLPLRDNQFVQAGDLLFEIDPRTYQAALDQARAELDETGDSVTVLEGQVQAAEAGVQAAEAGVESAKAGVESAEAGIRSAESNVESAEANVESAKANVESAHAAVGKAQSGIAKAAATIEKDKAEYERQQGLLPKKATSQKAVERAKATYKVAVQQMAEAEAGLRQAEAGLAESRAGLSVAKAALANSKAGLAESKATRAISEASLAESKAGVAQAKASLAEARAQLGALGESNPQLRAAQAAVKQAELNLEFTEVRASVDGYVTNLNLRIGSQAVANQPALALVDVASYWIVGFFKENTVADIRSGDRAIVTLMTYDDTPIEGHVDSLGWGIAQQDGSTGFELLPNVSPTFEWIRLAQRVPVRIHLGSVPKHVRLRVGTTCSVQVKTGTADPGSAGPAPAAPTPGP